MSTRRLPVLCILSFGITSANVGTIFVPADYATIQEAIVAAVQLDTIVVSPGTYTENIHYLGKLITITSVNPEDPEIVASTIIDGGGTGVTVTFSGIEDFRAGLTGFTVINSELDGVSVIRMLRIAGNLSGVKM